MATKWISTIGIISFQKSIIEKKKHKKAIKQTYKESRDAAISKGSSPWGNFFEKIRKKAFLQMV